MVVACDGDPSQLGLAAGSEVWPQGTGVGRPQSTFNWRRRIFPEGPRGKAATNVMPAEDRRKARFQIVRATIGESWS